MAKEREEFDAEAAELADLEKQAAGLDRRDPHRDPDTVETDDGETGPASLEDEFPAKPTK